jgi:hypothetical protein
VGKRGKSKYTGKFKPGYKFGHWTVVNGAAIGSPARLVVHCECGTEKAVDAYTLAKGKSTSCGCIVRVGEDAPNWQGVNGLSKTVISRNLSHTSTGGTTTSATINFKDAASVYAMQSGTCGVTGQTLTETSARLERMDPSKPYTSNNVIWVHNSISPVVSTYGVQGAITIANAVVSNTSQPNNIFEKLGFKASDGKTP